MFRIEVYFTGTLIHPVRLAVQHGVRERGERLLEGRCGAARDALVRVDEREQVLRPREVRVERPLRDRHLAQQGIELLGRRLVDAAHH